MRASNKTQERREEVLKLVGDVNDAAKAMGLEPVEPWVHGRLVAVPLHPINEVYDAAPEKFSGKEQEVVARGRRAARALLRHAIHHITALGSWWDIQL